MIAAELGQSRVTAGGLMVVSSVDFYHSSLSRAVHAARAFLSSAAALFIFAGAGAAYVVTGGGYDIEASVIDAGGGTVLEGGGYRSQGAVSQTSLPQNYGYGSGADYVNRTGFYNPPHFTFQKGLPAAASTSSGEMSLSLPPDSVDKERFDITVNRDPRNQAMSVDPGKIDEATSKIINNEGPWSQLMASNIAEMTIFDEQDFYEKPLAKKGTLAMTFMDANNDGILDGSNPPVRITTLNTWVLDQERESWLVMPDAGTVPGSKTVITYFNRPGVYAMLGAIDNAVRFVKAYPVPFRPYGPQAGNGVGQTGTEAVGITFENVPQTGNIEIYTPDGRLVRKIPLEDDSDVIQTWDVKTASGERAASGVYIWRVVSGSSSKTGKLMVIW